MADVTQAPVWKFRGPVTGPELERALTHLYRGVLAKMDTRFAQWDGASALLTNADGTVTVKSGTGIDGRSGSSLPTIVQRLANNGTASDSRLVNLVNYANRNSVQSSSAILTSASGASTSTITVAAHSVKFDWGTVSYNTGAISGLTPNTAYLVYATDTTPPAGGAVTYAATTNPDDLIATNRYYVGSITTAIAATASNITAATSANPIAFTTSAAHGWTTGDQVQFASLPGDFGTNLNGNTYSITVTGASTFTIAVDGSAYAAYTTGGTATRVSTSTQGGGGAGGGGGGDRWDGYAVP